MWEFDKVVMSCVGICDSRSVTPATRASGFVQRDRKRGYAAGASLDLGAVATRHDGSLWNEDGGPCGDRARIPRGVYVEFFSLSSSFACLLPLHLHLVS